MNAIEINIQLRRKSDADLARRMGYTKNHFFVEMWFLGKWRPVGFYTPHQISKGLAEKKAAMQLKQNASGTVADKYTWQEDIKS
jgi:hypothetical protein